MGDASFPAGYWESFRDVVKSTKSDALIISETWQKDSTLLRMLQGDRADTTMNYRLRDAVLGYLTPGAFDSKGFADSGRPISPTEFGNRIASIAEDYPDAALFTAMNLLDSHDTERLAWTLTPGAENRTRQGADRGQRAGRQALGPARLPAAVLDARRADRLLRRRGRHDRRRRPRRPPALPVGGPGRLARPGDAGPLHGPGQASSGGPRAALRGPADPAHQRRRGDRGDRAGDGHRCGDLRRQPK